jgi:hypothetical protein
MAAFVIYIQLFNLTFVNFQKFIIFLCDIIYIEEKCFIPFQLDIYINGC